MNNSDKKYYFWDAFGLISIGLISLGYILYRSTFAEKHIQFSFLDFPVFIGEILLFICLILFFLKCKSHHSKFTKWHCLITGYFVFVIVKALTGYNEWGPLAFRHAALLCYPVFAVLGCAFYRKEFFNRKTCLFLSLLVILIFINGGFSKGWIITLVALTTILVLSDPSRITKILIFLLVIIFTPYIDFFHNSRTVIVSNFVTVMYLVLSFLIISNFKKAHKITVIILGIIFIAGGIMRFSSHKNIKSIINLKGAMEAFNAYDEQVQAKIVNFKMKKRKAQLYHPENAWGQPYAEEIISASGAGTVKDAQKKSVDYKKLVEEVKTEIQKQNVISERVEIKRQQAPEVNWQKTPQQSGRNDRSLGLAYNNVAYRFLIWRDMIVELVREKPLLGFDFGKPLRSISLEILDYGKVEWIRDGWVTAHNSYLAIIYRAGIVGILFIASMFIVLFKMIRRFIQSRSVTGILLCAIIIYWCVAANFLLIFELPYTAIPIWTLYGMTFAYYRGLGKMEMV